MRITGEKTVDISVLAFTKRRKVASRKARGKKGTCSM